jgi:hypothetical protein
MVCIRRAFIDGYLYRPTKYYSKAPKGFEHCFVTDKEWEQRKKLLDKGKRGHALAPNTEELL